MDFDPDETWEGTSDGRFRREHERNPNSIHSEVTIKQEDGIKEEPNDYIELVESSGFSPTIPTVEPGNPMEMEADSDDELNVDYDSDCVKQEIKREEKEDETAMNRSCENDNEQSNRVNGDDRNEGNQNVDLSNSNNDRKRQISNDKVKAKGRNRILTKKRSMATASKTRKVQPKPKKIHKCSECDYNSSCKSHLTRHIRIHTGERPFGCEICAKSFTQKNNLIKHKKTHLPQSNIRCSKCHCRFKNENEKNIHESKCKRRQFECHLCKHSAQHLQVLKHHVRFHHTGGKPFECSVCSKTFTTKWELAVHSRVHKTQLPFACMKCGQRFVDKNDKQSHENRCKGRRLECHICRHNSFYMSHLKQHILSIHTGDKPFHCGICDKKFGQKCNLNQHLAIHAKQRPIRCSKCLRRFKDENVKMEHEKRCKRRHYQCYLCKVNQHRSYYLKNHLQKHHVEDKIPKN